MEILCYERSFTLGYYSQHATAKYEHDDIHISSWQSKNNFDMYRILYLRSPFGLLCVYNGGNLIIMYEYNLHSSNLSNRLKRI